MKNGKLFGVIALAVTMLIGCGPAAHIEKANNIKLNKYQSFAWAQNEKKASRANLAEQKVKDAVSMELEKTMGWREVKSNPDLILSYDVLVEKGSRVQSDPMYSWGGFRSFYNPYRRRFYNVYYPSHFIGYDNYRVPVKNGTIVITMVDTNTGNTVVQGWATDEIDSSRITTAEVNRIVKAIFKKLNDEV
ncbi:MAG TPA: DUF4136 domain-containing protein [Niabella sp.]|nr:DUF4136 domain-containing protein [Niabella sp.]HOZ97033.1 DUF4136 domain-containing protein [Niabella sp.]HQW15023.1 DUF4136 domain-containing protein [Niabella sp.]HQX20085.1 DUF4136 domain-containing protein [Niabella sp.]HQX40403.1 DUF4136 domain-containing protein [Niabella sp.]